MDESKLQNKNTVSIIYISWQKELDETMRKLYDLHKSNIIAYAKMCELKKSVDTIPTIHVIMRFHKRKSILQIKKIFSRCSFRNYCLLDEY